MSEGKNYILNCDVCDTRKMSEDLFEQYEKIVINADVLIVNERSKAILNKYPIKLNVDAIVSAEEEVDTCVINGDFKVKSSQELLKSTVLIVNGSLTIEKGAEDILKKYIKIIVNSNVKYPESIAPYVNNIIVNGKVECYPDDCILLKKSAALDKYFNLRAKKDAKYYATEKVIIADSELDIKSLKDKNIHFLTKKLTILEEKISDAIEMFEDNIDISVIPNGCKFINGDVTLDAIIIKKYGSKLYINGNLNLNNNSTEFLKKIEYLNVEGVVNLLESQKDEFSKIDAVYKEMSIVKEREIKHKISVTIDEKMLSVMEGGVSFKNCAKIVIKPEITNEKIVELLQFKNCAKIVCTEKQKSAVEMVSENVVCIGEKDTDNKESLLMKNVVNSKVINSDNYIL